MFTGLIEALGRITEITESNGGKRFTISIDNDIQDSDAFLHQVQLGDSIAVDGACMTVIHYEGIQSFSFEASPESLKCTILGQAKTGKRVNLERPLTPNTRIGGHFVTGHVDGFAKLLSRKPEGNSIIFTFETENEDLAELLIPKGSVAILGISLTVNIVQNKQFSVAIIPHTLSHTSLGDYEAGMTVNMETDMLGKYVRRFLPPNASNASSQSGLKMDDLALQPAVEALVNTSAYDTVSPHKTKAATPQIRTGGWFNFTEETPHS
jgi:riboflavin synthase